MARVEGGAWIVSRILGTTMPTRENWLDLEWVKALHGLSSSGVTLAAFQSWCRNVSLGKQCTPNMDALYSRKRGLVDVLPNPSLNKEALLFRPHQRIGQAPVPQENCTCRKPRPTWSCRVMYWGRLDVTFGRLSPSEKPVPQRIQGFYSRVCPAISKVCTFQFRRVRK